MIHDKKTKDSYQAKMLKGIKNKQDTLVVKAQMDFQFESLANHSEQDFDWLETIELKKELNRLLLENLKKNKQLSCFRENVENLKKIQVDRKKSESPGFRENSLILVFQNIQEEKEESLKLRRKINKLQESIGQLKRMNQNAKNNAEMFREKVNSSKEQKNFLVNAAKVSKSLSYKFQCSRNELNNAFELNVTRLGDEMNKIKGDSIKLCSKIAEKRVEKKEKSLQKEIVLEKLKSEVDKSNEVKMARGQVNTRLSHFQFYFSKVLKFIGLTEGLSVYESTVRIIEWLKNAETLSSSLTLNFSDKSSSLKKLNSDFEQLRKEKDKIVLKTNYIIHQPSQNFEKALNNNYENLILKIFSNHSFIIEQFFRIFTKAEKFSVFSDPSLIESKYKLENQLFKKTTENPKNFSIKPEKFQIILEDKTIDSNLDSPLLTFFLSSSTTKSFLKNHETFNIFQYFDHLHSHLQKTISKNLKCFKDLLTKIKSSTVSMEHLLNQPKSELNKKSLKYLVKLRTLSRSQPRVSFLSAGDLKPGLPDQIKKRQSEFSSSFKMPDLLNSIQNSRNSSLVKEITSIDDKIRSLKIIKKRISAQGTFETSPLRFSNKFLAKNDSAKRLYKVSNKLINFHSAAHSRKSSC